jgi:hypothetical protein
MKYSLAKYNREKEEHKDDPEGWLQEMLVKLMELRAVEDLIDSTEAAVKNMEIISCKATHLVSEPTCPLCLNTHTTLGPSSSVSQEYRRYHYCPLS